MTTHSLNSVQSNMKFTVCVPLTSFVLNSSYRFNLFVLSVHNAVYPGESYINLSAETTVPSMNLSDN